MTEKERINAAMNFQHVDHVPTAVLDGGVWITDKADISFDELLDLDDGGAKIVYEGYEEMNSDIIWTGSGCFTIMLRALGAEGNFSRVGQSAEIKPMTDDPEYFNRFDILTIRSQLLADKGVQGMLRQTRELRKIIGQEKYISTISAAPFTLAGQLIGVQNLMLSLFDDGESLSSLFKVVTIACAEMNNLLVEAGADMVCLADLVASGALIGQEMFEEYALPLTKEAISMIKGADHIIMHICGNTTARLESLKAIGISAFSLDAVNLPDALTIAKGHYAIMGNLSPFDVMASMNADEVRKLSWERCTLAGTNGGFILAPGCDLPNAVPLDNILALHEGALQTAAEYPKAAVQSMIFDTPILY